MYPASSFSSALHPQHEAIKAKCEPWILAFTSPASKAAADFWLRCEIPLLCSFAYAHCEAERVVPLVKLLTWFFSSDTDDDDPLVRGCGLMERVGLRHELIMECYSGKPLRALSQLAAMKVSNARDGTRAAAVENITKALPDLHDIWKDILPHLTLNTKCRYLDAMRDHLNANRLQSHYRRMGRLPGVDEYIHALRRPTSLVLPCLILIEYGLGIELDDETVGSESMVRLLDAVIDHIALANDCFSYQAEKSYGDYFNLPNIIFHEQAADDPGFTFVDAVRQATSMVDKVDKECVQLLKEIEADSTLIEKPGVRAFLRGLELWMAGNVEWSLKTARYTHKCTVEGNVLPVHAM